MIAELIPKLAEMENEDEQPFSPRPSSAGPERCIRQMVYHGLRFPRKPFPGRAFLVFDDGHWHEELSFDWIRKSSYKLHSEQMEVKCREPMDTGHIDGIMTGLTGKDILLEHKAINHFGFQNYWGGEYPLDNLNQTAVYSDAIQTTLNPNMKESLLLIKNKNTAQYMEFHCYYEFDVLTVLEKTHSTGEMVQVKKEFPNIVMDACKKFDSVLFHIENKILPKRPYDLDHWRCQYCGWAETCWENYEWEFSELGTEGNLPDDIADTIRYYRELGAQKKEMEKEYESLKKKVKDIMKESGMREGKAGEYLVKLSLIKQNRIDKELLSPAAIEAATKESFYEKLTISKRKNL